MNNPNNERRYKKMRANTLLVLIAFACLLALPGAFAMEQFNARFHDGQFLNLNGMLMKKTYQAHTSVWYNPGVSKANLEQGQLTVQLQGQNKLGKDVKVSGQYRNLFLMGEDAFVAKFFAEGSATYWVEGTGAPKRVYSNVVYVLDKTNGEVSIYGGGDVTYAVIA